MGILDFLTSTLFLLFKSLRALPAKKGQSSSALVSSPDQQQNWDCLQDVLEARAKWDPPKHLFFYSLGNISLPPKKVSYRMLYGYAKRNSSILRTLRSFAEGRPVLLHLEDHWDTILWFWAVLLAGGIPVLSSPLSNVQEHRNKHLQGLSQLLESPLCITRSSLLHLFEGNDHNINIQTLEALESAGSVSEGSQPFPRRMVQDGRRHHPAVLMLTSGSTGNAKAVSLAHRQILAAVAGKASVRPLPADGAFLNWIGLDHVASLVEIHIQALWLGVDQVHVHAADVAASPRIFLHLLSQHRISRSFAPNFFLAKLVATCSSNEIPPGQWDLSNLTVLASGGEANDVQTCHAASALLTRYGAHHSVITPGFGMTETCAGAIFNLNCPSYDVCKGRSVASLGCCMPGIQMRVTDIHNGSEAAAPGELGNLEVRGDVVFEAYYRNQAATTEAFTIDGWFRTGDQAILDEEGNLCLVGRAKDVININGVKVVTADIQALVEATLRQTETARVVCFPSRPPGAGTEQVTVAFVPQEWPPKTEYLSRVESLAVQACLMVTTASRPVVFSVGPKSQLLLPISSLGKISGAKMATLFETGEFDQDVAYHRQALVEFEQQRQQQQLSQPRPVTAMEAILQADFAFVRDIGDPTSIGVEAPMFELGFTSMDLIRLKYRIDTRMDTSVPVAFLLKHPTVRSLAAKLDSLEPDSARNSRTDNAATHSVIRSEYDPVVVLKSSGTKAPLWLVHPGVGEVLVFVGLTRHMHVDDRPIYALRARGFESGTPVGFTSISEAVNTYVAAISHVQPRGPYAIAGYSYGAMLAFEIAKQLESSSGEVRFLGSFNLPPHIKPRMRQLNWNTCLLNLSQFLSLIDEDCEEDGGVQSATGHDHALAQLLSIADSERMQELGLTAEALERWADVAYSLQSIAVEYEPSGSVGCIDVFHAEPLRAAAKSREEWVTKQLSRWTDFSRTEPRIHAVGGAHYTMLSPNHVASFAKTLRKALAERRV